VKVKASAYRAKRALDYVATGMYDVGEVVVTTSIFDMVKAVGSIFDPDYEW